MIHHFCYVYNPLLSAEIVNKDLIKISKWAYEWKMSFNPDITKQAQEVIFSRKSKKTDRPTEYFNHAPEAHTNCHKHLGMHLGEKLNFLQHIKEKPSKANRRIGVIRKLRHILPRHSLITIYKSFVRPHLDCCDIILVNPTMKVSATKLNTMLFLQLLGLLEEHHKLNCTMNLAFNHLNSGDG